MTALRASFSSSGLGGYTLAAGALVTVAAAWVATTAGPFAGLGPLVALLALGAFAAAFLAAPHVVIAGVIPLFAMLETLRVFVNPQVGPLKDVVVVVLVGATLVRLLQRRLQGMPLTADPIVLVAVATVMALYLLNLGGGFAPEKYGAAWLHGVRLVWEPLLLLLVGLVVADPLRTFRWGITSLIGTAAVVAAYGIVQQGIGPDGLAALGYEYNTHIRWIGSQLRSFGTFDGPFAYAGFLLLAVAAVVFWLRAGPASLALGSLVGFGLMLALVRSSAVIVVALLGIWIARRGHAATAVLLIAAAVVGAVAFMITSAGASESRTIRQSPSLYLTLNGRTQVWSAALGGPSTWPFGRGVGVVGTAAARAEAGVVASASDEGQGKAVDSGYLSALADVGIVGLAVLLTLHGRLIFLAQQAARAGSRAGWVAIGFLTVILVDALTRDSFTGFPSAFVGLLMIGLALAAAREERRPRSTRGHGAPLPAGAL